MTAVTDPNWLYNLRRRAEARQDDQAEWRSTPATMAVHLDRSLQLYRYTELLGRKYADAAEGRSRRQIWNLPSRYGKTTLSAVWGSAWHLDRWPDRRLILITYGDALARESATSARDVLREHERNLRVTLRKDRSRQGRWWTTEGGGIHAAGIGAGIVGFGGHGIVFDDPYKNWEEAHSERRRLSVSRAFKTTVRLRLESDAAWIIVVHTRWHQDDLTGELLHDALEGTGEQWDHVRIPAIAEAYDPSSDDPLLRTPDALGRQPGEALEPMRFSLAEVQSRALALGSYLAAGLEQQRPAPEEGGELRRSWWRLNDVAPAEPDEWLQSWDMKLTDRDTTASSYVVGQVWVRAGAHVYLVDQLRGQWDQATTVNAVCLMLVRWPEAGRIVMEATGNYPEVRRGLMMPAPDYQVSDDMRNALQMSATEADAVEAKRRRGIGGIIGQPAKGSKVARARAVSPYIEAGNVHLLRRHWHLEFIDEAAQFPFGQHDDQVDAMSQGLKRLYRVDVDDGGPIAPERIPTGPAAATGQMGAMDRMASLTRAARGR